MTDARSPFPVLCDRCAAEGLAGEAGFERLAGLGDLLDFEPVPRRVARADGRSPEIQRAYVAALAVVGSERQAAAIVGRAAFGVTQLRKVEGNEGFLAACDKAMEIWNERERTFIGRSDLLTEQELHAILEQGKIGSAADEPIFIYDRAYDFRRLEAEREQAAGCR